MKKLLKNKKGFTLVELLAVIVVLGIIMAIAAGTVTRSIATARENSWRSACKALIKEAKRMTAEQILDSSVDPACSSTNCYTLYDVSSTDYKDLSVTLDPDTNEYTLSVSPTASGGKFSGVDMTDTDNTCSATWPK